MRDKGVEAILDIAEGSFIRGWFDAHHSAHIISNDTNFLRAKKQFLKAARKDLYKPLNKKKL